MTIRVWGRGWRFPAIRPMTRALASSLVALSVLLLSRGVWASAVYELIIRSELGLPPGPPICTLCHASDDGTRGTVIKPFGLSAMKLGLRESDVPKLKEVLLEMEATNVDSDCDGMGDIAEIRKGRNPNVIEADAALEASAAPEAVAACDLGEPPRYGCYCSLPAHSAKKSTGPSGAALGSAGLFAVLLVARRLRRAPRSCPPSSRRPVGLPEA